MTDDDVVRVARAIHAARQAAGFSGQAAWEFEPADIHALYMQTARAALFAMPQRELLREALTALDGVVRNCQTISPVRDNIAFSYSDPVNPSYVVGARRVERARAVADKIRVVMETINE